MHQVEQNIAGNGNSVIIGTNLLIDGFRTVAVDDLTESAAYIKSEYPSLKRLVNISSSASQAIEAAYKTASGLYDQKIGKLTDNIYQLNRSDVALLALKSELSESAFGKAAYELAKDIHIAGDYALASKRLADASGKPQEECAQAIAAKTLRVQAFFESRSDRHDFPVIHKPASADWLRTVLLRTNRRAMIKCPTGWGKSSLVINPCIQDFLAAGKKVLVISHRRSIIKSIDIPGLVDYEDVQPGQMQKTRGLKVVVNSLISAKFDDFIKDVDLVVIDEAAQVLDHVFEGSVQQREVVWNTLKDVVHNAKSVVFADADINDECLALIRKGKEFINCFEIDQAHTDVSCKVGALDQVRAMAISAAQAGQNTLIAIDIARDAEAMGKVLEKAGIAPLVITSKSAGWPAQAAFIANPNTTEHQVVIYSPAITSALSITSGHFQAHYGLFEGSVTPRSAIQMMRRDRTAKEFMIGLRNPQNKREEIAQVEFDASAKSAFDDARKDHMTRTGWLRDNIQLTLPYELKRQGFCLEMIPNDNDLGIEGFKANSAGRRAVKKDTALTLMNATAATEAQAKRTKKLGSSNEAEHYAAIRFEAQAGLKRKELSFQDAQFWGEGIGQVKLDNYRKLFVEPSTTFEALVQELHNGLLSDNWTPADSVALYDRINQVRHEAILGGFKMPKNTGSVSDRSKQGAISEIMSMHGLKTKRKDGGKSGYYYVIDSKSLEQMQGYTGL
ncbi:replication protein RepA [Pseudomonas shirazensis]|uniref:replication protein RepA n=1 Tax=Pseudomonas shirazensis TaxID=2745494 RepID=UPI003D284496